MIKILKYLHKKDWMYVLFGFIFILAQVWLDLKLPDYMSEITMLVQTEGSTMAEILNISDLKVHFHDAAPDRFAVNGLSFSMEAGEIVGLVGESGSGKSVTAMCISGLLPRRKADKDGNIMLDGKDITGSSVRRIRSMGLGHIPEDRMTSGVAPNLSITENVISDKLGWKKFVKFGILNQKAIRAYGEQMVQDYQILCKNQDVEIGSLSGGNIQKGVVARELSSDPRVVVANQPTRGVDVGASEFIRQQLINMRDQNKGILLITSDLNEVLGLADSLIVMYEGKIVAYISDVASMTESELGTYMLGINKQTAEEIKEAIHEA